MKTTLGSFFHLLPLILFLSCLTPFYLSECDAQSSSNSNDPDSLYAIIYPDNEPVLVIDGTGNSPGLTFTEGPSWMDGVLYFSNILWNGDNGKPGLHALLPDGSCVPLNDKIVTEGSMPLPNGNLAICDLGGKRIIEMSGSGEFVRVLADSCEGIPLGQPNDLTTDTRGGVYFTQPGGTKHAGNTVYYITPAGEITPVVGRGEIPSPNGCVVSADGTKFYLGDYHNYTIWEFDVNPDGTLANKRQFATVRGDQVDQSTGKPIKSCADGMAIDHAGHLYIATRVGIQVYTPSGALIGIITLPKQPAHCVFGGDDLSILYTFCKDQVYAVKTKMQGYEYPMEGGK